MILRTRNQIIQAQRTQITRLEEEVHFLIYNSPYLPEPYSKRPHVFLPKSIDDPLCSYWLEHGQMCQREKNDFIHNLHRDLGDESDAPRS